LTHYNSSDKTLLLCTYGSTMIVPLPSVLSNVLICVQGGSNFSRQSDMFKSVSSKFGPSTRLDEKTLREAAMGYFALKQKHEEPRCCSLCGHHPKYLICNGLFGLANKDGSERKGGIASTTQNGRASFTHPDKRDGVPFQKTRTAGVHYSGVSPVSHTRRFPVLSVHDRSKARRYGTRSLLCMQTTRRLKHVA
jgi:hypothetical protein